MTEPGSADLPGPAPTQLSLDSGEILEVGRSADDHAVVLRMPATRAYELSRVLDAYTAMVELSARAGEVSSTEVSLARGLSDAATATGRRQDAADPGLRVGRRGRLLAMAELQAARPDLTHGALVAVVDAAAEWLGQGQDYNAAVLLDAVAGEDGAGSQAYLTLIGYDRPPDSAS